MGIACVCAMGMKLLEDYSYEGGSRLAPPPAARAPVAVERQFSCGEWPGNHALLDQATKYEPTTAGVASVDAERQRRRTSTPQSRTGGGRDRPSPAGRPRIRRLTPALAGPSRQGIAGGANRLPPQGTIKYR